MRAVLQELERVAAGELALAQARAEELGEQLQSAQHKCTALEETNASMVRPPVSRWMH